MILTVLMVVVLAGPADGRPAASPAPDPPLAILSATGAERDGLPEVVAHPDPAPYLSVLTRGYSGRLLRLYALAQRFSHPDRPQQPALLVLSDTQGGFPRRGFHDGSPQPEAAYVDLHRKGQISGRAGAMDQIFPHELLHIIVQDLAGAMPRSRATQVHAVGVRTDRVTAFNEGFAEHGQVMAIDDEGGVPETRRVASDVELRERAFGHMAGYRRAVGARWSVAPKARMTFPLWFSGAEQVLRYHAVKDNLFALEPDVPPHLYVHARAYHAYLLENVLPGAAGGARKPAARLVATEGVVSTFFYRLVSAPAIQQADRDEAFYRAFGTRRSEIDGLDNAYLKVFAAIRAGGYDTVGVAAAYGRLFPDEREALEAVWRQTFGDEPVPPDEIWLLNRDFRIGTSLFDQFRGSPRGLALDVNAASLADLVAITGVDRSLAAAILDAAPFATLDDLRAVPGMTPDILERFTRMERAMREPAPSGVEAEELLSPRRILMPYLWRALAVWLGCAVVGAFGYRLLRRAGGLRLASIGAAAALAGLVAGWVIEPSGAAAVAAPVVLFGLPASASALWRTRSPAAAARVLAAWTLAAIPPALAVTPLG